MSNDLTYALNRKIIAPGSLGIGVVQNEGKVRFVITDAGGANLVRVRARIVNQPTWTTLADFTGNVNEAVDVFTYDEIEVLCLVFSTTAQGGVNIVASSFDGSVISISTPSGDIDNINTVVFTSVDASIVFNTNPTTGTIDFSAVGGGGGSSSYSQIFNVTSDWAGPSGGCYTFTVLQSSHNKTNPTIHIYELSGSDYLEVDTGVKIDSSDDVIITVSSTPDLRFVGKIVIS